jgi:hypothetical protein
MVISQAYYFFLPRKERKRMMLLTKTAGETITKIVFMFDEMVSHCQILFTRFMASEPPDTK